MLTIEEYTILIHKLGQAADSLKRIKRDTKEIFEDTKVLIEELDELANEFRKAKEPLK
jgi:hypothetical protein